MTNRLKLDFSLNYNDERSQFLNNYLQSEMFQKNPPTEDELETMTNYVLWGKDRQTGLNGRQSGIELETKHGTWDSEAQIESLDALMESPSFNEAAIHPISEVPFRQKRTVFSRDAALAEAPEQLRDQFRSLFRRIDETEISLNYYEMAHGKRANEPREWLRNKFSKEERAAFQEKVSHWNQFRYLKMRHLLIELRREQYALKDQYAPTVITMSAPVPPEPELDFDFEAGIEVLPLGIFPRNAEFNDVFRPLRDLNPGIYDSAALQRISKLYWAKQEFAPGSSQLWVDFRNEQHLYSFFGSFSELEVECAGAEDISNLPNLMRTLNFYVAEADLSDLQREILDMKLRKVKNTDIAFEVNRKWRKSYTPNYISTIFKQGIIPKIAEAAKMHQLIVGNLFFEEEFKVCTCCGKKLLKSELFFTHKARSKDGFATRCKCCEKKNREEKKR